MFIQKILSFISGRFPLDYQTGFNIVKASWLLMPAITSYTVALCVSTRLHITVIIKVKFKEQYKILLHELCISSFAAPFTEVQK